MEILTVGEKKNTVNTLLSPECQDKLLFQNENIIQSMRKRQRERESNVIKIYTNSGYKVEAKMQYLPSHSSTKLQQKLNQ